MSGKPWRPEEDALLRDWYAVEPVEEFALAFGRTARSVWQRARLLGLRKIAPRATPAEAADLGRLHGLGLPDREIARRLGWSRHRVKQFRRRDLGLPCNPDLEGRRAANRTQRERLGCGPGGRLRSMAFRRFARESGWPEDLSPRAVQILNVLAARGVPMTRFELAAAIGMRTDLVNGRGRPVLLKSTGPGGNYTAYLLRRDLLAVIKRSCVVHGRGKGRSLDLYTLGPTALAILQQRADQCTRTATETAS